MNLYSPWYRNVQADLFTYTETQTDRQTQTCVSVFIDTYLYVVGVVAIFNPSAQETQILNSQGKSGSYTI